MGVGVGVGRELDRLALGVGVMDNDGSTAVRERGGGERGEGDAVSNA